MIFEFLNDWGNYEDRRVYREEIDGLTVSTALTSDEGFETAILDANGAHPVQRYCGENEAELGHAEWCDRVRLGLSEIVKLGGFGGLVEDRAVKLERSKS